MSSAFASLGLEGALLPWSEDPASLPKLRRERGALPADRPEVLLVGLLGLFGLDASSLVPALLQHMPMLPSQRRAQGCC